MSSILREANIVRTQSKQLGTTSLILPTLGSELQLLLLLQELDAVAAGRFSRPSSGIAKNRCERIKIKASILQFLVGQMAQEDGPPHLSFGGLPGRPQGNLGGILGGPIIYIYNRILGTKPPISHYTPLESSQDFPEGFLEGLQSLHAGLILGEFLSTKKQETMPYDDSS